jgi:glycosyltransferase involved in cell wall biosynthesis
MRILIVSDAWFPQINGVVRTLNTVRGELEKKGHRVEVIGPSRFRTIPCPTYPEIPLAIDALWRIGRMIRDFDPQAIHIATEGPLGMATRRYCRKRKLPFTTSYHTRFPEYVSARMPIPSNWVYGWLRRFHGAAERTLAPTESIRNDLTRRGFRNVAVWGRGVDTELFRPRSVRVINGRRPVWLFVGRVAVEKNLEAFLGLDLRGTKVVVGDGPMLAELKHRYPDARFVGAKHGEELAEYYSSADAFVFPSRTDTFGLVLLEALASGLPVAAFPVPGPIDVVGGAPVGRLYENLAQAAEDSLEISRDACRQYALSFTWETCAETLLGYMVPFDKPGQTAESAANN